MDKKEFIIDRSKWRCGDEGKYAKGLGHTSLLNNEGFLCCLGQIAKQIGYDDDEILGFGEPCSLYEDIAEEEIGRIDNILLCDTYYNTELSSDAIYINDNNKTTIKEKEKALKELFKEHNLKIKFIGKSIKYEK